MDYNNIPLSLGMAITTNQAAMDRFVDMTEAEKEAFIDRSRDVMSKEEMEKLVNTLTEDEERPDVHLEDVNDIFKGPSIG
ncbi:MAG: hypothetical protein K2O65_02430 [Lachnospiraceae bacterium]|nr:hypothetical protein [Lachnospiraceae bacterium]